MTNDTSNERAKMEDKLFRAASILESADFNIPSNQPWIKGAIEDQMHAEYRLKNLSKGKTLEAEVKEVIKMGLAQRQEYYRGVFKEGGPKAATELTAAVKKHKTRSREMEM